MSRGRFQDQDGLLGLRLSNDDMRSQRYLLACSSHYLPPIDHFDKEQNDAWSKTVLQHHEELDQGARHQGQHQDGVALMSMMEASDQAPHEELGVYFH